MHVYGYILCWFSLSLTACVFERLQFWSHSSCMQIFCRINSSALLGSVACGWLSLSVQNVSTKSIRNPTVALTKESWKPDLSFDCTKDACSPQAKFYHGLIQKNSFWTVFVTADEDRHVLTCAVSCWFLTVVTGSVLRWLAANGC